MSKVLKFIVNLLLFCGVLSVAVLTLPSLAGINTIISDGSGNTNFTRGSVTYTREVSTSSLSQGQKIVMDENGGEYCYTVQSLSNGTCSGKNEVSGETRTLELGSTVERAVLTIPVIGYLAIAVSSREGIMILGLVIVFIVILFILSEVWADSDDEEDQEQEETDSGQEEKEEPKETRAEKKERKRLEKERKAAEKKKQREKKEKEETKESVHSDLAPEENREESAAEKPEINLILDIPGDNKTEEINFSLDDEEENSSTRADRSETEKAPEAEPESKEIPEEILEAEGGETLEEIIEIEGGENAEEIIEAEAAEIPEEIIEAEATEIPEEIIEAEATEIPEEIIEAEAAEIPEEISETETAVEEITEYETEEIQEEISGKAVEEISEETEEFTVELPEAEEEPEKIIMLAIPVTSAEELIEKARAAGDDPEIIEDKETGITFLDYSDLL